MGSVPLVNVLRFSNSGETLIECKSTPFKMKTLQFPKIVLVPHGLLVVYMNHNIMAIDFGIFSHWFLGKSASTQANKNRSGWRQKWIKWYLVLSSWKRLTERIQCAVLLILPSMYVCQTASIVDVLIGSEDKPLQLPRTLQTDWYYASHRTATPVCASRQKF
jgi:hypothetical protein